MAVRTSPADGHPLPDWVRTREGSDPGTVHLIVVDPGAVTPEAARQCCTQLARLGYRHALTNAMAPDDADVLVAAGFTVRESLDLLGRSLAGVPARGTRTNRPANLRSVVALDARAFGDRAFDRAALRDALDATRTARIRVAGPRSVPLGYAITGVAGPRAYLQRLAVDPTARRRGIARALVADGLRWARRRRATTVLVNTHQDNDAARALYESAGFVLLPRGLHVLERTL